MTLLASCCSTDCCFADPAEPCYGETHMTEEGGGDDYYYLHSCEGHVDVMYRDGPYKPEDIR